MSIAIEPSLTEQTRCSSTEKILDVSFIWLTQILAWSVAGVLIWMAVQVGIQAQPAFQEFGLSFLTTSAWNPPAQEFGVLPMIYGTIVSSLIALLIAFPVGLACAIVLSEDFLPQYLRQILTFMVELLAAIPSVVYGLWGIYVLIPFLKPIGSMLHAHGDWIPLFATPKKNLGKSGQPSLKVLISRQGYRPQAGGFYTCLTKIRPFNRPPA